MWKTSIHTYMCKQFKQKVDIGVVLKVLFAMIWLFFLSYWHSTLLLVDDIHLCWNGHGIAVTQNQLMTSLIHFTFTCQKHFRSFCGHFLFKYHLERLWENLFCLWCNIPASHKKTEAEQVFRIGLKRRVVMNKLGFA